MLKLQSIFLLRDGTGNGNDRVSATRQQAGFPENFEAVETKGTLLRSWDSVYMSGCCYVHAATMR